MLNTTRSSRVERALVRCLATHLRDNTGRMHVPLVRSLAWVAILAVLAGHPERSGATEPAQVSILPGSVIGKNGIILDAPNIPSKAGWRALVCTRPSECELRPVRLRISRDAARPETVFASIVRTRRSKPGEMTVALIAGLPDSSKAVDTYFTTRTPRNSLDAISGSIGIAFNMPDAGLCRILPRWNNKKPDNFMTLYVEQGARRQPVGIIPMVVLNKGFKTRDILIWAGDIDGDGKLDLITRNTPDRYGVSGEGPGAVLSTGLNLWLSTQAPPGGMMGLAASLDSWEDVVEEDQGC